MQTKVVIARPVSQPSEVVASKNRYRCNCWLKASPGW
jgi:hypothetical protein